MEKVGLAEKMNILAQIFVAYTFKKKNLTKNDVRTFVLKYLEQIFLTNNKHLEKEQKQYASNIISLVIHYRHILDIWNNLSSYLVNCRKYAFFRKSCGTPF